MDLLSRSAVLTRSVAERVNDSIVYMDSGAGEAAFASYGMKLLQGAKPILLRQLKHARAQDAQMAACLHGGSVKKAVIILNQLLTAAFDATIKALQIHRQLQECLILTSFSEAVHALETDLDEHAYAQYAAGVQQAVHQQNKESGGILAEATELQVWVQHFPLHICPLTNNTFVLPASSPMTRASYGGKLAGYAGYAADNRSPQGPQLADTQDNQQADNDKGQTELRLLAHSLIGFAAQQDLRLDTFALGPSSRALGDQICALPVPHGPGGSQPIAVASLLLVDRHMDLLTPALHQDHVLDCIFGQLAARTAALLTAAANGHKSVQGRTADSELAEAADSELAKAVNTREEAHTNAMVSAARGENTATVPFHDAPDASNAGNMELGAKADDSLSFAPQQEHQTRPSQQQQQNQMWQPYSLRSADIMVPMSSPQPEEGQQVRGLAGSVLGSGQAREWLQFLMGREAKDALLYLRKWLREAARKEDVQLKTTRGKLTDTAAVAQELMAWSEALAAKPTAALRQRSILQLAYAAVHGLKGAASSHWDALHEQEQQLMACAAQGLETLSNALVDIWRAQQSRQASDSLQLQDVMLLTCISYWLAATHGHQEQQDVYGTAYSPWLPEQESAIKAVMVETLLQAKPEAVYQLPWLQDLPGRLATYHSRHRKMLTAEDSSSPKHGASEGDTWASLEQESNPLDQQTRQQRNSTSGTSDEEHPVTGEVGSRTILRQQQQQQVNSVKDDGSGEDSSDVADTGSSLYTEQQQIRLELQHAVEEQLAEMRGTAALQARTQRRLGPLVNGDQQESVEGVKPPLILILTRAVLQHQPILGLYHASASIRGMLKSGLGRIGLLQPKQPHPADHKTVIVFVLGGIGMAEIRAVQQAVSVVQTADGSAMQVMAGGTVLTRPIDLCYNLGS